MISAEFYTYDGRTLRLPVLSEYRLDYGLGLPCDAFEVHAPFEPGMAEILPHITRFKAFDGKSTVFHGVVDEYSYSVGEKGMELTVCGRSLAALLLDTEVTAAEYQVATLADILRVYVTPAGIGAVDHGNIAALYNFNVGSGTSRWQALFDFVHFSAGITPRFLPDGTLVLRTDYRGRSRRLSGDIPFSRLTYRDKRYGVISEVKVINRVMNTSKTVYNTAFIARGGAAGRVMNVSGATDARAMAYTGEFQIEKSSEGARSLEIVLPAEADILPGDTVDLDFSAFGIAGRFTAASVTRSADIGGYESACTFYPE